MTILRSGPQKKAIPLESGSVPMDPGMFAGESEALQRLGSTIQYAGAQFAAAGRRRAYVDYTDQYNKGVIEYDKSLLKLEQELLDNKDFKNQAINFNFDRTAAEQRILSSVTNTRAKEKLQLHFDSRGTRAELDVFRNARLGMIKDISTDQARLRTIFTDQWFNASPEGKEELEALYDKDKQRHVTEGVMTQDWSNRDDYQLAKEMAVEAVERRPGLVSELRKGEGFDVLMPEKLADKLTSEDKDKVRRAATYKSNFMQYQANLAEEKLKGEYAEKVWDIARTGDVADVEQLIDSFFHDQVLFGDGSQVTKWKEGLASGAHLTANRLKSGEANPYTTITDYPAYWAMEQKIRENPQSVSYEDIDKGVPNKWGVTSSKTLRNMKDQKEPALSTPQAEMYFTTLGNLVIGDETKPSVEQTLFYDKAKRALTEYLQKNPDATPEQLNKFYSGLIEPFMKDWWGKNWEKLTKQLPKTEGENEDLSKMSDDELRAIIKGK